MIEYDPNGPSGDEHDLTPPADLPEHHLDDRFAEPPTPPLDDLRPDSSTPPDELHFPGDDVPVDDAAPDTGPGHGSHGSLPGRHRLLRVAVGPRLPGPDDDPAADADLRDKLTPPSEDPGDLPASDSLVDWTMRRIDL